MLRSYLTIADVEERTGIPSWTVRRLEAIGKLPPARRDRLSGNRRIYTESDVEQIRTALRELGAVDASPR
jgi:DNA-binding transcriptional MerR regulator